MVVVKHLFYLALATITGTEASWLSGRGQNAESDSSEQGSVAQILARSPQGPGKGKGGPGRGGPGGPVGKGGRGGGGPFGPGGPGGPFGNGPPPFAPNFPGGPFPGPPFLPFSLRTSTITAGTVDFTSTVFTTDRFGRPTLFVLVAHPASTTFSETTAPFATITPGPLLTITRTVDVSAPFTETVLTTDAFGSLSDVVYVNVPATAPITTTLQTSPMITPGPLQTFTRTIANGLLFAPFTETVLTTDAAGDPTSFVLVNVPATPALAPSTSVVIPTSIVIPTNIIPTNIIPSEIIPSLIVPSNIIPSNIVLPTSILGASFITAAPSLETITVTGGAVGFTSTIATIGADGSPSSVVIVGVPAPATFLA